MKTKTNMKNNMKTKINMKKHSRKLKNKNFKRSRKMMSGGGKETLRSRGIKIKNIVNSISDPQIQLKNSEGFVHSKPIQELKNELGFLYQCKYIQKYKYAPSNFLKYKCFYENSPEVNQKSVKKKSQKQVSKTGYNVLFNLENNNNSNKESLKEQNLTVEDEIEDDEEEDEHTPYKKDTLLYVNKATGESFSVYERTNQSIGIEYNKDKIFKEKGEMYDITPLELSVDTMQLAINTGCLEITTNSKNNNTYLGFKRNNGIDFPSLSLKKKLSSSGFSYTSREHANWVSVYEEEFNEKDKLFDLIETVDGRHIDQTTFDSEIESIKVQISKLDKDTYKDEIDILVLLIPESKNTIQMSNETLFIKKQEEMRTLLEGVKPIDEKEKQRKEAQVKYRAYVNVDDEDDKVGSNKNIITEDISWAMQNALWLEKYLKIKSKDNSLTAQELKTKINEEYKCDLSGLDEHYLIVDDTIIIDGETYVICGYPDKKMKEIILNFWQDEKMRIELDKVHKEQKDNFYEWFKELFNNAINSYLRMKENKLKNEIKDELVQRIKMEIELFKTYIINNNSELYKLFIPVRQEGLISYIQKCYKEYYKNYELKNKEYNDYIEKMNTIEYNSSKILHSKYKKFKSEYEKFKTEYEKFKTEYEKFKTNYEKNMNEYFTIISNKYMNKIITNIKYVFLIFKLKNNNYIPSMFNIKEINETHMPILERLNKLIKNKLPSLFNIQEEYNTIDKYDKLETEYDTNNEYKLFYSYYRYGKIFHIKTEYIHIMGNISNKFHNYKNSITLDQIIYSANIKNIIFWKTFKLKYSIREYQILNKFKTTKKINNNTDTNCNKLIDTSRTAKVFCLYDLYKKEKTLISPQKIKENNLYNNVIKFKPLTKEKQHNINNIKIILIYKSNTQEYAFIYKYNNDPKNIFFKIIIKSNIINILDLIIYKFNKNISETNLKFNESIKLFLVVYDDLLSVKEYIDIFKYNPLIVKNILNPIKETNDIDVLIYYDTSLEKMPKSFSIYLPNLYKLNQPKLYYDYINDENYKQTIINYNNDKINKDCNVIRNLEVNNKIFNCSFINVDNCGYDFWEFIIIEENKLIIFILPNKEHKTKFLHSFIDLDNSSIKMLIALKNKYSSNNYECFFHYSLLLNNNMLHLHITKKDNYKRPFPKIENGSYILRSLYLDTVINNIINYSLYYKNINFNLISVF